MRILQAATRTLVAMAVVMTAWAVPATAQTQLKLNQVGAALALPLIGTEFGIEFGLSTYLTITNVGPEDRNLHLNAISGDGWNVTDFDCPVTASETVLIRWTPSGVPGSYRLTAECNFGGTVPGGGIVSRVMSWDKGILFVANETEECKDGTCTTNANDLFGDFVVVNALAGLASSAEAIPFQGQDPLADGVADRDYLFDNDEYSMFPATLATNFIAPGPNPALQQFVTAELVLFTLDGRANLGSQAALDIVFFDDEETPTSAHYDLDCFAIVPLTDIDPNFAAPLLGSSVGHVYMTAIDADQASNVHDNKFGNGNAIRVVGVHGWLLQSAAGDGIEGTSVLIGSSWARSLAQGMLPQDLDGNDTPAFDGL